ncbi:aldo/keto reductase [Pelagicoccus enzymogenes]|uniref:aldo/keto reductase n=1 Tax=Pelagicoccus enzymogenes TaxID=2773457 RepID=UPI00280FC1AD|nr:aldo/keto reductase [Pelagicoccus enzymogenes]MDQ8200052.1 aldo/keto reductase [Pelagicoccus enzymogenes]
MERRDFIKRAALASGGFWALGRLSSAWAADVASDGMAYGTLGRTGARVSRFGFGTAPIGRGWVPEAEAIQMVHKALDEGINYFDTAPIYQDGESERRLGKALKGRRDEAFVVTKIQDPSYGGTMRLLEESLGRLQMDAVDLVHLHNFGDEGRFPDLDFLFGEDGAMGALREAKRKGMLRFVGASGHLHPSRFQRAIDSGEVDALMVAVNYINQHTYDFEHKVWNRAAEEDIGLVSMKMFGGGSRRFKIPEEDYEIAMRYTLSLPDLSTAVIGLGAMEHLDRALQTFRSVKPLSDAEFMEVARRGKELIESDSRWQAAHGYPLA